MVAGHLQQKKGYWYMVLNLHDQAGRRKTKWIATHLPVPGNRKRAEELLFQTRHQYADSKGESGLLFADYMLQWLGIMKAKVSPTTYTGYRNLVENSICPYFWERRITLAGLRASDVQRYYDDLLASGVSGNITPRSMQSSTKQETSGVGHRVLWANSTALTDCACRSMK